MNLAVPTPIDLDLIAACEQRIVNAWPAPTTVMIGDWVVRMANGYSGRANSASPMRAGADLDNETLDLVERLFRERGLPPCVRVTPLAASGLRARLDSRSYRFKDGSFGMIAPAVPVAPTAGLVVEASPTDSWMRSVSAFQVASKQDPAKLKAIIGNITMTAAFATLHQHGQPRAFGMAVVERGMAEIGLIMVDAAHRGNGLGRRIVSGLVDWARANGAAEAYLQVDRANTVAIALYQSIGFRIAYAYDTLVL